MSPIFPSYSHRSHTGASIPFDKENHSIAVPSKLHRYNSLSSSSSSNSPVPDLASLHLHHCPPRNSCHNPVSWTLDHDCLDDESQAAEILTNMHAMTPNSRIVPQHSMEEYAAVNLVQSDSMDGHVDPVSCQLMQVDEFDDEMDNDADHNGFEGRDETSGQGSSSSETFHYASSRHYQDQSPPAPRRLTPSEMVQRPQPHRLQLFAMPSASYSYDEE
ncbi:hypothetical protein MPSEU_000080500 [Mayamaea pseudoterrestris]|nr:hypothetical protein MPSEU_000080500 [Mayamaea pseudoterrestris]